MKLGERFTAVLAVIDGMAIIVIHSAADMAAAEVNRFVHIGPFSICPSFGMN
jgi:hypothetical protein